MFNHTLASFVPAATAVTSPLVFAAHAASSSVRQSKAYATASTSSLTRAQVSQEALAARRSGTLQPAGEGAEAKAHMPGPSAANLAYVQFDARLSRARGELRPAGEAELPVNVRATGPTKTRAEVEHDTQAARLDRTLTPAGEAAEIGADVLARRGSS